MEILHNSENSETSKHLLTISEEIVRYAAGQISYQEYRQKLDDWWEKNKETTWQENDLTHLFLICCLAN